MSSASDKTAFLPQPASAPLLASGLMSSGDEKKEKKEERSRKEFELKWNPSRRRMDSLARLLSCNSQCVAVAVVNGVLRISANELKPSEREAELTEQESTVQAIMKYFQEGCPPQKRLGQFKQICKKRLKVENEAAGREGRKAPHPSDPARLDRLIKEVFDKQPLSSQQHSLTREVCEDVWRDFRKVEDVLKVKKQDEPSKKRKREVEYAKDVAEEQWAVEEKGEEDAKASANGKMSKLL